MVYNDTVHAHANHPYDFMILMQMLHTIEQQCQKTYLRHGHPAKKQTDLGLHCAYAILMAGPCSLVDRRVDSKSIRFLTAMVRASLGHM